MIFKTPLTWLKRVQTGIDELGNPTYGYPNPTTVYGEFRPLQGDEPALANRDLVVIRFRVFLPASVAVSSADRIAFLGRTYEVKGEPEPHNIGGRVHHYEAIVELITG